ncbi:MAG: ABC transporter permease subunit [Rhodobacteraceae bacterium]|nr:ABC transporter permease subunit [Paracoccaceae bacterium]
MSCAETFAAYALRAVGIGERLLPRADITFCEQAILIGSGMIWNIYFAVLALALGFFLAVGVALARASDRWVFRAPAQAFIFVFRGSPLFIQFFIAYETFVLIPKAGFDISLGFIDITAETRWLTKAWLGALIVLFLNTSAYTAQIFHGALMAVPKGDVEAADAIGMSPRTRFRRVVFPTMLRLAWASYTNEAIFLFHATTLVFFSSFPAWRQKGDALYYANYFADKTFNPFVPYPIIAAYFVLFTLLLTLASGLVNRRLNRHLRGQRQ